jgi:hypothetical protein
MPATLGLGLRGNSGSVSEALDFLFFRQKRPYAQYPPAQAAILFIAASLKNPPEAG